MTYFMAAGVRLVMLAVDRELKLLFQFLHRFIASYLLYVTLWLVLFLYCLHIGLYG